jgi:Ca2+-binding RTX toxin-like protein
MAALTKIGGFSSSRGAEIPAFDPNSDRLFVVSGSTVEILNLSNPATPSLIGTLEPGFTLPAGVAAVPNSVAVKNGIVAVGYAIVGANNAQQPGRVAFFNASGTLLNAVEVGFLPDMLTFTPDGKKVLTANEGEPNSYGRPTSFDPVGSVSVIDLSNGVANATVANAGFEAFNSQKAALQAQGIRIFGPGATVAQDLEPEYIAFSADGKTAYVTLQENNALAIVDVDTATVSRILPLGVKNHNLPGNGLDASDRDGVANSGRINIQNWPVVGLYQPDAIASFTVGGQTFLVTANEGDARDYPGFAEEVRVGAGSYVLDPTVFPNASVLKNPANLGRLTVTNATGNTDGDGDFDRIEVFGSRSFSIWDAAGRLVFDSGDQFEQLTADRAPLLFNSNGAPDTFDTRSDNKGPEPEGVVIGVVDGRTFAFVGLERTGDVVVYEVTNPADPVFVQYFNAPEDISPEGLTFVSAADSPTGTSLLITANEVSNTTAIFEFTPPARIDGTAGNDTLFGTNQAELLRGLDGDDNLYSNGGADSLFGNAGNDALYGSAATEELDGGSGDDRLFSNGGNDTLIGGTGNDQIFGSAASEFINGGAGNDLIYGNGGSDIIFGGAGDDLIYSGSDNDRIDAGSGNDTLWLNGGQDVVVLRRGDGTDTINNFQLGQTRFGLADGLTFGSLSFSQGNGFTQVLAGNEVLATVNWVQSTSLNNASNFTIA